MTRRQRAGRSLRKAHRAQGAVVEGDALIGAPSLDYAIFEGLAEYEIAKQREEAGTRFLHREIGAGVGVGAR